jgi:hypothetical protein
VVEGQHPSPVINGPYVNLLVEIYGEVEIGQRAFIAGDTLLSATEGTILLEGAVRSAPTKTRLTRCLSADCELSQAGEKSK